MIPTTTLAGNGELGKGPTNAEGPLRALFVYVPHGVVAEAWKPCRTGAGFELPPSLEPLAGLRRDLTVLSGFDRSFAADIGVHAQAAACWLSSSPPTRPLDGPFPTDRSLDRLLANHGGSQTPLPSLDLSCSDGSRFDETRYFESISWHGPGYPAPVEKSPSRVFHGLFGNPAGDPLAGSILDAVRDDAKQLSASLGRSDRQRLEEYLTSVRSLERRVQLATLRWDAARTARSPWAVPGPTDRGEYIRLMADLIVQAFALDLTRVATLVIDAERWSSPQVYPSVCDLPQDHHSLTHAEGNEARDKLARIDRFHVEQFAYLAERLTQASDGHGRLIDRSVLALGSGMADGSVHSARDLPLLLLGSLGGRLRTGQHLAYPGGRPLADVWLSIARGLGLGLDRFADSTGPVSGLMVH